MTNADDRYQIYGRTRYDQPLTFVKEIGVKQTVTEEVMAAVGGDEWIELIAVPVRALIHVMGKEESG